MHITWDTARAKLFFPDKGSSLMSLIKKKHVSMDAKWLHDKKIIIKKVACKHCVPRQDASLQLELNEILTLEDSLKSLFPITAHNYKQ